MSTPVKVLQKTGASCKAKGKPELKAFIRICCPVME
jgi:hypothetical protein